MDYHGTEGNDDLDQTALGLSPGSNIFGGGGADTIRIAIGNAVGGAGNDNIIGQGDYATAAYWGSPSGVVIDLVTGIAQDGYGSVDTLQNIRVLQDSGHSDRITGSAANEDFWLSWGSDTLIGGGGADTVNLYNVKSSEVTITYDMASDTFTLVKNTAAGDKGTTTLTGISRIVFNGPQSDNTVVSRDMYDYSDGFLRARTALPSFDMNKVQQMRSGDFNRDGKTDILVVRANPDLGLTAEPLQVLLGDGAGGFTDQTASVFAGGVIPKVNYVPRIFTADFNKDGVADIFNPDFGYDAPPFPGGQNSLYLSNPATGLLENATASLPQALLQSHGTSIGDVNRDGFPDLLVNALNTGSGGGNLLMINDGTGHFVNSPSLLPASLRPAGYAAGYTWSMLRDLNNDGYDDIVLGTWDANGGPSLVVLNDGKGSFASATPIALPATGLDRQVVIGIETIDLNGDNLPDLVVSATNGGSHAEFYKVPYLQLLVNEGNGVFRDETATRLPQSMEINSSSANWYLSATAVDLNGDGFQDIVADGTASATSKVFMNDGHGNFTPGWESGGYSHILAVDVNGDGKMDLVESSINGGYSVLMNAFPNRVPGSGVYHAGDAGERIAGGSAAETIHSGKGNDAIDGGAGTDKVVYTGNRADYSVTKSAGGFTVNGALGTDTLTGVERLVFGDRAVALDIDGIGGQAYRIYQAAFDRTPDTPGLGFWMAMMDRGTSLIAVAQGFVQSNEFKDVYGAAPSNLEIVSRLYQNILNRPGEAAGIEFWTGVLDRGQTTIADVLAGFSESNENKVNLVGVTQNGVDYDPFG
ncbi:FG-GAP-like repeat-containing protein [Pseudoduganella sp. GCM10020061]|uniref:FG-GAP-like repeat-containing protein n=1 Tax=Pseudoduganella sp. GCM10020061 TaxID=3317345 RepID=UPI00363821E3